LYHYIVRLAAAYKLLQKIWLCNKIQNSQVQLQTWCSPVLMYLIWCNHLTFWQKYVYNMTVDSQWIQEWESHKVYKQHILNTSVCKAQNLTAFFFFHGEFKLHIMIISFRRIESCKIWGSDESDYADYCPLGCNILRSVIDYYSVIDDYWNLGGMGCLSLQGRRVLLRHKGGGSSVPMDYW
jgi:hypothetical protein